MEEKILYQWDADLVLSDADFAKYLTTDYFNPAASSEMAFPSDCTLAKFSDLAYKDTDFDLPEGWSLLTTASNNQKRNGYFGAAFWNPKLCQIVISHRGTSMDNFGAVWTDVQLAFSREETKQSYSAATFVHKISEEIKAKMQDSTSPRLQLTITGHSLGAWLAQITTFTLQYFRVVTLEGHKKAFVEDRNYMDNIHAHTVVFESPGCKTALDKLGRKVVPHRYSTRQYGNYNTLDMTVYLSKPNFINVAHEHVGFILIVPSTTHKLKGTLDLFDPETHEIEREVVREFPAGKYDSLMLLSPFAHKIAENYLAEPYDEDQFSLNVFSACELDFVKDWDHVIQDPFPNVQELHSIRALMNEYLIPKFKVDYDSNLIESKDLHRTIARIKNLRPTRKMIFKKLNVNVKERVQYEIFKKESEKFQKSLLDFHNYYFEDNYEYGVKRFLNSENKVLRIRVDSESKYKLELSLLNNITTFYRYYDINLQKKYFNNGHFGFITWSKLRETLQHCPNIFHNYKVQLLVVEYFEADETDTEAVLSFLRSGAVKVIIVSMGLFYSLEETVPVIGVNGLASNITFQDLTTDSQALIKQTKLILHEQESDLVDVFLDNSLLNNEVLLEIITNPTKEIFINSQYNKLVHAANFLDRHCEIEQRIIYDQDALYVIQHEENIKINDKIQNIFGASGKENIIVGNKIDFDKICQNLNQPAYLFTLRNDRLFLTKMFDLNFYIHRRIRHAKILNVATFKDLTSTSTSDRYYFCGDQTKFKKKLLSLKDEQRDRFRFVNSEKEARWVIKNADSHAHLLKIENDQIFWLHTKGNIRSLRKCVELSDICIEETELTKDKLVIICGDPGVGKSSMIGYLQLYLIKKYWSFTIPLKNAIFHRLPLKVSFEQAFRFILENVGVSRTTFMEHLLLSCLKNVTQLPVYLMFDEYDEISQEISRKKFVSLVNVLRRESKAKILITTRKYRCEELENGISVFGSYFEVADGEANAKQFLSTVWGSQLKLYQPAVNASQLKGSVTKLLGDISRRLGKDFFSFIDIPLNIRMLAEVVGSVSTIKDIPSDTGIPNILGLYQKYTEIHCNIFFKRSELSGHQLVLKMWMLKSIFEGLRYLAVRKLFNMCLEVIEIEELEELNKVGLIRSDQIDKDFNLVRFEFLHDTVGDYFVGNSLGLWLDSFVENSHKDWDVERFLVSDLLIHKKFKELRLFLNCQLEEFTIASDRLEICRNKFQELWESDRSLFFDQDESIFHVCFRENLCYLLKHFVFKIVDRLAGTELLSSRNSNLKTPLLLILPKSESAEDDTSPSKELCFHICLQELDQWTDDNIKTVFLATLFTYHVTSSDMMILVERSKDYKNISKVFWQLKQQFEAINTYLNEACTSDNPEKLNSILQKFQDDPTAQHYLLRTTNSKRETGLHLCNSREVLNQLLDLGLNMDLQDYHGMTPLTRAIKENKKIIAKQLIEESAALTPDNFGNTPLIHAAKQDHLDLVKALLSKEHFPKIPTFTTRKLIPTHGDIDQRLTKSCLDLPSVELNFRLTPFELAKKNYLEESNVCKLTPLMFAVRAGSIKMVKYLVNQGADINAVDYNGMTSVHHDVIAGCAKKMIKNLKKLGADINIANQSGVTPLLYAVKKRKWNKVKSLLDNGADVNIGSTDGVFPLQILNQEGQLEIIDGILRKSSKIQRRGSF